MKTKLFVTKKVPGSSTIFLVGYHEGDLHEGQTLFTNILPKDFALTSHVMVSTLAEADYALFPHALKSVHDPLFAQVEEAREQAAKNGKKLIVFVGGDISHNVFVDGALVLKGSQYKRLKRSNEIIVVPICEDFKDIVTVRSKSARPVVSFCGWAGFASTSGYLKYLLRNIYLEAWVLLAQAPIVRTYKKGLYWRRRSLRVLEKDSRIDTRFIIRTTFSANKKTISLDPEMARREYVENMNQSDFVLCPKGDGNFSVRFYEALSMGRIPILIDTDVMLPFEDRIDYESFILRVSYTDVSRIGDIVSEFYASCSEEQFKAMQCAARAAYDRYLRIDSFFNELFSTVLSSERASK